MSKKKLIDVNDITPEVQESIAFILREDTAVREEIEAMVLADLPAIVRKLLNMAKAGDIKAVSELRMLIAYDVIQKASFKPPKNSKKVMEALGWKETKLLSAGQDSTGNSPSEN